jgi:hypothetical protein
MAKLVWGNTGEKFYETGVSKVVFYPIDSSSKYTPGVAWNGVTEIDESPSGAEITSLYADDEKYVDLISKEEYSSTIKAYHYPKEFEECDGTVSLLDGVTIGQQTRKMFGLCYKTIIGNDVDGDDHGYKLHLVYGLKATPSEKTRTTINDSPEASEFSWEAKSTPVPVSGKKPTSTVEIDSTALTADKLAKIEEILYGSEATEARLPLPDEISTLLAGE